MSSGIIEILPWFKLVVLLTFLIIVPYVWVKLRGERSGDPESRYLDPSIRPTPFEEYGEFKGEYIPQVEAGVYGPTRSSASYWTEYFTLREWIHPDFYQFRESLRKMRTKTAEKEKKSQQGRRTSR